MTSIPVAICRFSDNNFKRLFLKNESFSCRLLIALPKCSLNLKHSEKKEEYPSLIITEIIASEKDVYLSV